MSDYVQHIDALSRQLGKALLAQHLVLATAESCTGGGVSFAVTQVPGSSAWFDRGFVTYSNASKIKQLGVAPVYLREFGAVSEPVARAMAVGALAHSNAQVAVAVTGIAGPDGGSDEKPVGTVSFGWAIRRDPAVSEWVKTRTLRFDGDRAAVRTKSIVASLEGLLDLLTQRQDI